MRTTLDVNPDPLLSDVLDLVKAFKDMGTKYFVTAVTNCYPSITSKAWKKFKALQRNESSTSKHSIRRYYPEQRLAMVA